MIDYGLALCVCVPVESAARDPPVPATVSHMVRPLTWLIPLIVWLSFDELNYIERDTRLDSYVFIMLHLSLLLLFAVCRAIRVHWLRPVQIGLRQTILTLLHNPNATL